MGIVFCDIETDDLKATKIHCVSVKPLGEEPKLLFTKEEFLDFIQSNEPITWVFHNGLDFDVWVLNNLWGAGIDPTKVIDTLVVSRTVAYNKFPSHALKSLGEYLGVSKGDFKGPWHTYTQEMGDYCMQDTVVTEAIFKYYEKQIYDPSWSKALRIEHQTAITCHEMHQSGFKFNGTRAEELLVSIHRDLKDLEDKFEEVFPATLTEVNRIKYRLTKEGNEFASVTKAKAKYDMTQVIGDELVCYEWVKFNPGSPKDRIDKLWEFGWKPTEKTKGHNKFLKGNYYG